MRTLFCLVALSFAASGWAEWSLNGEASSLGFATIKAGNVGESHGFERLSGSVADDGQVQVQIDLSSVDTSIDIRDERMREFLFEVATFPRATLSTAVAMADFLALEPGGVKSALLDATLSLHGTELGLALPVSVSRLSDHRVMVASARPVIVHAGAVNLAAGVEKLRELAGLPAISEAVPVSFVLVFDEVVAAPTLKISDARMRMPIGAQDKTVAYFSATNTGTEPVVLKSATTSAARAVELHTNVRTNGMVRMRRLKEVVVAPGETVEFAPGGHHLMVFGVRELEEEVTVTLIDERGGRLDVPFRVFKLGGGG